MGYAVFLKIDEATHHHFDQSHAQLNQCTTQPQSKQLGIVLSDISCQIIQQVFGDMLAQQKHKPDQSFIKQIDESE
ncbi:hypothetical protein KZ302_27020, partial [Escherichia coli]|uniref:hypothetical protein n=1 Tax=Escherichia coli TaxID=562 RepID=UPI00223E2C61